MSDYKSKWETVLSEESEDAITLVAITGETIVGTVHVSRIDSTKFDAQLKRHACRSRSNRHRDRKLVDEKGYRVHQAAQLRTGGTGRDRL